ncbi:glutamine ABC transporter permease [Lactococcus hodotermopsidis]|uniref:Glutamine ABC transporter permease n=1 Tax=Pseudolactococcus hodotermopsidis TaxID=2709157 RepID=A0A6A0BF27_9LACT|nr:amino acid ABC transporter permease [Lactococcus hodotermopsidis]GFH43054.1 glutamine ABC transporter permease [Lactococcus hodotermopsidis]
MSPFALERWQAFFADFGQFAKGFLYTLEIAICALILAMVLGAIFGSLSATRSKLLRAISRVYVEFYQNTPLLIQFMVIYYGFPLLNKYLVLSAFWTAVICVGLYHGAYIAEVIRSGIEGVPKGQTEAAESQGFTYGDTMRIIILPQAVRMIFPPLTNQVVNLIKNTSTVAIISGADLMFTAKSWSSMNMSYIPAFVGVGALYFVLCFPLATLARRMEEKNKNAYSVG